MGGGRDRTPAEVARDDVEFGMAAVAANTVDFVPGVALHSFPWRAIGQVLAIESPLTRALSGRARFTVRPGASAAAALADEDDDGDALAALPPTSSSTVAEGAGDLAATFRLGGLLLNIAACNLSFRSGGADAPLAAFRASASAGLRASAAMAVGDDAYAALSYDVASGRPELSMCWTGETPTERASLSVHADPIDRALRLRAAVSTPGPEWRSDVLDEYTGLVEFVRDDGGRHAVWVEHEARPGNALLHTRAGARLDVGRAANWLAAVFDNRIRTRLPAGLWRIPGAGAVYNFIIPPEDEEQFRYRLQGWELDVACADAARPRRTTRLALTRRVRLFPKKSLALTEDSEVAVADEARARLDALPDHHDEEDDREEVDAMLAVMKHRAEKGKQTPSWRFRHGEITREEKRALLAEERSKPPSAAADRALRRRLIDEGFDIVPPDVDPERWGFDKRTRQAGVSAAVGAAYDLGTGALGAELRLGTGLRAVAGVGTLTRSGGFNVAPSLTLAIEPLALF